MTCRLEIRRGFSAMAVMGLLLVTGCTSFGREWKQASTAVADRHGMAGRWEGEWRSHKNRHHGKLRAIATARGAHRYQVRYRAGFAGIFRFGYRMEMDVTPSGEGRCEFAGQASLGLAGVYQCAGHADGTSFVARYATKGDYGVFELRRPSL